MNLWQSLADSTATLVVAGIVVATLVAYLLLFRWIRYIPNNKVGIVEKLISGKGSVQRGLIALHGEAGFQPDVLRGGWHLLTPLQYRVHKVPLVTIPQGKIGYVFARDGQDLPPTQALASSLRANDFQHVRGFLEHGGHKGPQRMILREGTYAINLAQFIVLTEERLYYIALDPGDKATFEKMAELIGSRGGFRPIVVQGTDDIVAIVTVHDGPSLAPGEIIAPTVGQDPTELASYHNNFQDPDKFLLGGGRRGRQLQVMVEGTYYINRLFATVEVIPKTVVDVGSVGVVVSYTGQTGLDLTGAEYRHGELVAQGERGVWSVPLMPGKYAFNTYAGKVLMVPTTNFILKWTRGQVGSHNFDENLAEVSLITKDAFEPSLPLSVVVHIDYRKASLVIQRFGDIKKLVEQTLDPMVSAYFKNIGQTRTLIQLLQDRSAIQDLASEQMREKFAHYNLELQEVLIGTPTGAAGNPHIEGILDQLRARQVAQEQVETYSRQQTASMKECELREAEARAQAQTALTQSEISISVQSNHGKAELARAQQEAARIQTLATAEAERTRILGEGEAKKICALAQSEAERAARVGIAEAMAVEEKVRAYGGAQLQLTQQVMERFAEAIEKGHIDIVPRIVMGGTQAGNAGMIESLLSLLMTTKLGESVGVEIERDAATETVRRELRARLEAPRVSS